MAIMDERAAYIVAGSFVGFLIEHHGLTRLRSLYETMDYETALGNGARVSSRP